MRSIKRLAIIPAAIATCGIVAGCFSYHRTVDETTTPSPVVETVPAPAPVVEVTPPVVTAPAVVAPETESSTTTTTTEGVPGLVERQRTTTYTSPY